jgi:hypothetical protein
VPYLPEGTEESGKPSGNLSIQILERCGKTFNNRGNYCRTLYPWDAERTLKKVVLAFSVQIFIIVE